MVALAVERSVQDLQSSITRLSPSPSVPPPLLLFQKGPLVSAD